MTYRYKCEQCGHDFELFGILIANREKACSEPCPQCARVGGVKTVLTAPTVTYGGAKTVFQRAGDGWKEVQKKIIASAGKKHTIKTK